ncbi:DDE-type integrase/transposase/recombinase [Ktedonobacter sp. SOSP1-52]|uniref:DDE-type integrase/transposase/recombinase n=1 Tax=Ktedonobacter sp. SOSP1-52 TaxID=2778366 RepID=UPI0035B00B55
MSLARCATLMPILIKLLISFLLDNVWFIRIGKPCTSQTQGCCKVAITLFLKGLEHVSHVLITSKLASYAAAKKDIMPSVEHCQHKDLNNRAETSHQPTRQREQTTRRFTSPGSAMLLLGLWTHLGSFSIQKASSQGLELLCPHARQFESCSEITVGQKVV